MIYYDISEARSGTRLQQSVIDAGKPVENLEMLTGADLLVTPYEHPLIFPIAIANQIEEHAVEIVPRIYAQTPSLIAKELEIPIPVVIATEKLWQASQYGILIQRKSGMDFTSSIPKLSEIFGRMKLWTPDPWLLIAANIGCAQNGNAVVDGKESGFTHKQVVSAKMSWSFSGGSVIEISRDSLTNHVIEYAERKLKEMLTDTEKFVVRQKWTRQNIVGPNDVRWEWMNVLLQLPGIGQKRAKKLADYCGNLSNALQFLSDTASVKTLGNNDVARVSDSVKFRKLLGIDDNNILTEIGIE